MAAATDDITSSSVLMGPVTLVGVAEVVRQTMPGRDSVGGVGVRFISFVGDSQRRFESYINSL